MPYSTVDYFNAIRMGDIPLLERILSENPVYLKTLLHFESRYNGFALNVAAFYGQPEVIEYLVQKKGVSVNCQNGIGCDWTALHHVCETNHPRAYAAAEMLLRFGANPQLKSESGKTPSQLDGREEVKALVGAAAAAPVVKKEKKPKEAEKWTLSSEDEVMSVRKLPDNSYRLTSLFNFEARHLMVITKDLTSGHLTQNFMFFDDIPDTGAVHRAHAKYKELGGKIGAEVIDNRALRGKLK